MGGFCGDGPTGLGGQQMQLADAGAHLLQQMSDPRIVIAQHLELLADLLVVADCARFRASTHDGGADRNDRQEHELQEIRPIEDLFLIARPQDRREPEDHESVERPDRADEHGDPRRQDIVEARNEALLRDTLHRQTSRRADRRIGRCRSFLTQGVLKFAGPQGANLSKSCWFPKPCHRRAGSTGLPAPVAAGAFLSCHAWRSDA